MSGSNVKSGMLSNGGKKLSKEEIEDILDSKIEGLSIQAIPLVQNKGITAARTIGKFFQSFIHPKIFSPTLSHIAIHLTLLNNRIIDPNHKKIFNAILEYGQYYSDESEEIKNRNGYDKCRKNFNNLQYYYINKDGARITLFSNDDIASLQFLGIINEDKNPFSLPSIIIMASNHYGISINDFINNPHNSSNLPSISDYNYIECDINNKITLRDLCDHFKGKNWEAKDYSVATHNCQDFAAEIIKILKAVRIYDRDKIRAREKYILPNCIISTLWDNEKLSVINTLGRVPVFGLLFDNFATFFVKK